MVVFNRNKIQENSSFLKNVSKIVSGQQKILILQIPLEITKVNHRLKTFEWVFFEKFSKIYSWKKINFILFENLLQFSSFYQHEWIFKRNGNPSQTLKPSVIERTIYCIYFKIGTKTVKILKFIKISQASEQIIRDLSEWRELESKRITEFGTELAMSKSCSRKKYGFSYYSNEKIFDEVVDLGYENSLQLFSSEHLLQMTIFEFDIFYRDPKKCFSLLRIYLHDWQKLNQFVIQGTWKKNWRFNRIP